ncbi:hypothetical protein SPBR_02724 [Sporothrix brasiliensis 5110]|uniref:Myb/SANT-like domain-containing protein n=1 Tax=Sporothrix brasiliensis 5110 TaxID=1398154 RepID=A0A0C2J0Z6_9PEZI|nr:uncharacterized protein SPBR_02724 [Sporothrix brasiliensis 5110]KIH92645.1 hypothetical protein SPBR_02724 [Sporothrix brasiliensis 5110]
MSEDESPRTDAHASVPTALLPWQKKPRFSWTPAYETTFFQSLCQSVQLGLRENMSFKPEAWNRALAMLREQGAYPTKQHLINKTDNARKKFRLWRGLMENPQFTFDPTTRIIKGSDDAWTSHLEKEPLARALRERPFENAEYLEILFPDVVGSGGQPKRVTKPRRKGPDNIPGGEAPPGTSIMRLANGPVVGSNTGATPQRNNSSAIVPTVNSTPVPVPTGATPQSRQQGNANSAQNSASAQQIRPTLQSTPNTATQSASASNSAIQPPPAPTQAGGLRQTGVGAIGRAGNAAALTPPDEPNGNRNSNNAVGQGQKRFAPGGDSNTPAATTAASKRRRTDGSGNANSAAARNRAESQANAAAAASATAAATAAGQTPAGSRLSSFSDAIIPLGTGRQSSGSGASNNSARADGITNLLGDVLSKYAAAATLASTTRWPEQAMEIFFLEFADEDMDLQLRIAEKILTDTSKAVMFCKMPATLRKHWVKRLREAISRQGN